MEVPAKQLSWILCNFRKLNLGEHNIHREKKKKKKTCYNRLTIWKPGKKTKIIVVYCSAWAVVTNSSYLLIHINPGLEVHYWGAMNLI